ncbi:hypothetical protein C8R44DRAFT_875784 [Mycena epipterygia]|nr:hypothetical protein C8R44DRAFT_875784 [Mycena epipterygia]
MASQSITTPGTPMSVGEKVFFRFTGLVLLIVPTGINIILGVLEYNQPDETPVDAVFVAWTAGLLVFLTVCYCVFLATFEAYSARAHLLSITATCFSGVVRFPKLFHDWGLLFILFTLLFYVKILPWLWNTLLTEVGMPGRVYPKVKPARPARPAQPAPTVQTPAPAQSQAGGGGESLPLASTPAGNESSTTSDSTIDVAVHPAKAAEPSPVYSTEPTITASSSTSQMTIQAENGGTMAVNAATVV